MFSTVGPRAFQGTVFVVRPDGSSITTVLKPQPLLEYNGAYGNSLKTFILASASQSTGGNNSVSNIVQYFPSGGKLNSLQQQLPTGQEGNGVPSPDNSQFVAEIGPPGPQLNLWVSDFKTQQFRQLTDGSAQDFNATWSPDGHQIAFTRLLPPFPSIKTQLMTMPSSGGIPTILFGTSEHVGEAAYSRDGKRLAFDSINGLETIDLTTMQRTVILTLAQLHGSPPERLTEGFGMSWARNSRHDCADFEGSRYKSRPAVDGFERRKQLQENLHRRCWSLHPVSLFRRELAGWFLIDVTSPL